MNCPKCQYPNNDGARFCVQCGTALNQAAPAQVAPAPASGSNKTALIVLGVIFGILLLFVVGIYTAFHMVANKVRALAGGGEQTSSQAQDASRDASDADAQRQGAQTAGYVIGNILGTDAKGKSDIGKALNNVAQAGQQIGEHQKAEGNNGAPSAQDTQQAMGAVDQLPNKFQSMIKRYVQDIKRMVSEIARVLKAGAHATFVMGNSCLRGTFIRNSDAVATAARNAGLSLVSETERPLPQHSRYLPMTSDSLGKRMRTETILTFAQA